MKTEQVWFIKDQSMDTEHRSAVVDPQKSSNSAGLLCVINFGLAHPPCFDN